VRLEMLSEGEQLGELGSEGEGGVATEVADFL